MVDFFEALVQFAKVGAVDIVGQVASVRFGESVPEVEQMLLAKRL
jgi:hypothetical protein